MKAGDIYDFKGDRLEIVDIRKPLLRYSWNGSGACSAVSITAFERMLERYNAIRVYPFLDYLRELEK